MEHTILQRFKQVEIASFQTNLDWLGKETKPVLEFISNFASKQPTLFFSNDKESFQESDFKVFEKVFPDINVKSSHFQYSDNVFNMRNPKHIAMVVKFQDCGVFKSKYDNKYYMYVDMTNMHALKFFLEKLFEKQLASVCKSVDWDETIKLEMHNCYGSCCKRPLDKMSNVCIQSNFIDVGDESIIHPLSDDIADKDGMEAVVAFFCRSLMKVKNGWKFTADVQFSILRNGGFRMDDKLKQFVAAKPLITTTDFLTPEDVSVGCKRKLEDNCNDEKKTCIINEESF